MRDRIRIAVNRDFFPAGADSIRLRPEHALFSATVLHYASNRGMLWLGPVTGPRLTRKNALRATLTKT